jgi:hypothetical protein
MKNKDLIRGIGLALWPERQRNGALSQTQKKQNKCRSGHQAVGDVVKTSQRDEDVIPG